MSESIPHALHLYKVFLHSKIALFIDNKYQKLLKISNYNTHGGLQNLTKQKDTKSDYKVENAGNICLYKDFTLIPTEKLSRLQQLINLFSYHLL